PMPAYEHIYRVPQPALANLAYFFNFSYGDGRDPSAYVKPLIDALERWHRQARSADLFSVDTGDQLAVCDLRPSASASLSILDSIDRAICQACDSIADRSQIARTVRARRDMGVTDEALSHRLDALVTRGLLIEDSGRVLNLAVPMGEYIPAP